MSSGGDEARAISSNLWVKKFSDRYQKNFWYNTQTKASVWKDPLATVDRNTTSRSADWEERHSSTYNRPYWVNTLTGESVWVDPRSCDEDAETVGEKRCIPPTDSEDEVTSIEEAAKRVRAAVQEDFPILAIKRELLRQQCHDLLVRVNERYGPMKGTTKTARSCQKDGMHVGMQGIFARIMWHQLLCQIDQYGDVGSRIERDGIFPISTVPDEAVTKELIDAGRTRTQAESIIQQVRDSLQQACFQIAEMRRSVPKQLPSLPPVVLEEERPTTSFGRNAVERKFYKLNYDGNSFIISHQHLQKLQRLYKLHTDTEAKLYDPLFLRRVFCILSRYDSLSGSSDGYQMAFPHAGFQWLRDNVGVKIECFASPLNCWNQRIFSVARDTDQFFGSVGNFFLFDGSTSLGQLTEGDMGLPLGGSFEANPPFVESIMNQMAHKIEAILTKYSVGIDQPPFSFAVIVPAWTDCEGIIIMTESRFLRPRRRFVLRLEKKKHNYRPGMQHRTAHEEQPSNVDTFVFFLQNDSGAQKWPVTEQMAEDLKVLLERETQQHGGGYR